MRQFNRWMLRCIAASLLVPAPMGLSAESGGAVVRLAEEYTGTATVVAQAVDRYRLKIDVDPKTERQALVIHVELPITGRDAWPVADVEVRDASGKALVVRRSGIEWHKLLIPVPAMNGVYYVQAVEPPGVRPRLPAEGERQLTDPATGVRVSVATWHDSRRAALSLRFDDSHPTHLSKAIPILREYGFRGTFMINPGADEPGSRRRSDFQAHRAEWEAVAQAGDQEFANHSAHHRGATGDADMEAEIGEAAEAIWKLSPGRSKLTALNLGGGTYWETSRTLRYYLDKYHHFEISGSLGMDDVYGRRVAAFREHVEQHIQRGLWCRVHFHSIGDGRGTSEANFRAALDIAKEHERDLWIAGMADIYKYQTERNGSSLSVVQSDARHFAFRLSIQTDQELYDQPLTVEVLTPASRSLEGIAVQDAQGKAIALRKVQANGQTVLRLDVPPRTADYTIQWRP